MSHTFPADPPVSAPPGPEGTLALRPYKGLMPYEEQDAPFFFGRKEECDIIIANLMASRLTLLYGTSGVGKSSILRAGVVPQLREISKRNLERYGSPGFIVAFFSNWSEDPVAGLTSRIRKSIAELYGEDRLDGEVAATPHMADVLAAWTTRLNVDLFIVLDQFEEYFLYHSRQDGPGTFAAEFPRAVVRPDLRVSFLVAIREDSLAKLDRFKGSIPNLFDNYLRIRHLDMVAARAAIEKPLEQFNRSVGADQTVTAEAELVDAVLQDVRLGSVTLGGTGHGAVDRKDSNDPAGDDARIETPYLQLVLERLWSEEVKSGSRTLRAATLRDLGGGGNIVRTHLDKAMGALDPQEQDDAAEIFHYLVTPSGSKISHTARDLAEYATVPEPRVTAVLYRLSEGNVRILRPLAPPLGEPDQPRYEIFHDVLAPAILDWRARHLEVRAAEARLAERLASEAEQKRAAEEQALAFRRRARTTRAVALGMALLLILMTTLAVVAGVSWSRQRRLTRVLDSRARAGDLAARANAQLSSDPALSLQLAAEGFRLSQTAEGEYVLRQALSASRTRRVLGGQRETVTGATFSRDGRYVLTVGNDGTARIWEASSGRQLASRDLGANPQWSFRPQLSRDGKNALLVDEDGTVAVWPWQRRADPTFLEGSSTEDEATAAAFSPDPSGDHVVVGHQSGKVEVWDLRSPGRPVVLPGHKEWVNQVAFSPDGSRVAAVSDDKTARVWAWRTSEAPVVLRGHRDFVVDLAFSRDGRFLATASWDGTARVWEWSTSKKPVVMTHDNSLNTVEFSGDGKRIVTASNDNTARVWDRETGDEIAYRDVGSHANDASFSPDGALVVTAASDGRAEVWEAATGALLLELRGHSDAVLAASFSPDGRSVMTASADDTARLWDVTTGRAFRGHDSWVSSAALDRDGRFMVTASGDGTARVWDLNSGRQVVLRGHRRAVWSAAFSRDGNLVVTAGDDGTVRVWQARTGELESILGHEEGGMRGAAFSPDGRFVVSIPWRSVETPTPLLWDWRAKDSTELAWDSSAGDVTSATFSPDGKFLLTTYENKTALLWDIRSGVGLVAREFRGHQGSVRSGAFNRDGTRVLTVSTDRTARIWDAGTGRLLQTLQGSASLLNGSFSPDDHLVVAGSSDSTTQLWNADTGQWLGGLRMHAGPVNSASFSPDGKRILTASDDQTVKLYPCSICGSTDQLLDLARQYQQLKYLAP